MKSLFRMLLVGIFVCLTSSVLADEVLRLFALDFQKCEVDAVPYVRCNEGGQQEILQQLQNHPRIGPGVHVGWSIEFNLRLIAARKPDLAILCDINQRVFDFFDVFVDAIITSQSAEECLQRLEASLRLASNHFFYPGFKTLERTIASYTEWLSEDNFQQLKQMYLEHRILHIVLNVLDDKGAFPKLAQWIRKQGYHVDTLYVSNIPQWVKERDHFLSNLQELIDPTTFFIHADFSKSGRTRLTLKLTQGKFPEKLSFQ